MKFNKTTLISFIFICFITTNYGQLTVNNTTQTPTQIVQNVLLGAGVTASNITFNGVAANTVTQQVGTFNGTASNVGLNQGVIMGSGNVQVAVGPNNQGGASLGSGNGYMDADLSAITPNQIFDAAVLEFDFIPQGDSLVFRYVFASEEYDEYACGSVNDAFGFFISGPGFTGPFQNGGVNLALIPGTNTPVSINTVNLGVAGSSGQASNCSAIDPNWASYNIFYTQNTQNSIQYDGKTVVLTARTLVQCGETYHIKLAIGDGGDGAFDSGVFIEGGSFTSNGVDVSAGVANGDTILYEGCNSAYFAFSRPVANDDFTINFVVSGTATNGFDYPTIPDSLVLPIGVFTDTIFLNPYIDNNLEGEETVTILIIYEKCGGVLDTISASLTINDYIPLYVTLMDSLNICPGEAADLIPLYGGGLPPLSYSWNSGQSTPTVSVVPPETFEYTVTVSDNCGLPASASALVWVQCPILPPNVFTPNGDNENDLFKVENLDDYVNPHLIVYNRWGKVVYEKQDYENDWNGTHYKTGKELPAGVYYFIVTPNSPKYQYNELKTEELKRTVSGYVHLMR
jgi:gliding motility-associated-like protein